MTTAFDQNINTIVLFHNGTSEEVNQAYSDLVDVGYKINTVVSTSESTINKYDMILHHRLPQNGSTTSEKLDCILDYISNGNVEKTVWLKNILPVDGVVLISINVSKISAGCNVKLRKGIKFSFSDELCNQLCADYTIRSK